MTKIANFFSVCYFRIVIWFQLKLLKRNFKTVTSLPYDEAKAVITKWKWQVTQSKADEEAKDNLYTSITTLENLIDKNPEIGPLMAELQQARRVLLVQVVLSIFAAINFISIANYTAVFWVVMSMLWCYSYCKQKETSVYLRADLCQKKIWAALLSSGKLKGCL